MRVRGAQVTKTSENAPDASRSEAQTTSAAAEVAAAAGEPPSMPRPVAPAGTLIPKLARGLLDWRKGGRWGNTQDNLTSLQALRRYFDVFEKDTPNYTGKVWVGTGGYVEQSFVGRNSTVAKASLDWSMLAPGTAHDVTLQKTGPGRMYYRIGITYAPKQTNLPRLSPNRAPAASARGAATATATATARAATAAARKPPATPRAATRSSREWATTSPPSSSAL